MPGDAGGLNDRLAAALAGRLALQMSVSGLPLVEEWMDMPLTRWLDSVPLPPEMPDGQGPPLVVSLGNDAQLLRWSAGGAPAGVVPKMVDYLRRTGALVGDFDTVDQIGQTLEPGVVGSWIEARPGAVTSGWFVADRNMDLARLRPLLGDEEWMDGLGGGPCLYAGRSVGPDPLTDLVVDLDGGGARLGAAGAVLARCGFAVDLLSLEERFGAHRIAFGARGRGGKVVSARLLVPRPGPGAAVDACAALGLELAPAVGVVERSIGAGEMVQLEVEWSAAGAAVVVEYVAGESRAPAN
ncbi:MAG TPA: hypothetical protein VKB80_27885 [Kofleriaceae bacterium]|nr:hypothetical protein [Kofleriaceae bacterium]